MVLTFAATQVAAPFNSARQALTSTPTRRAVPKLTRVGGYLALNPFISALAKAIRRIGQFVVAALASIIAFLGWNVA
eukprot:CAMPEP_0197521268 /NCGR_PEP_ID=MMETSP1318-20131121/6550_1 /TAXON_ID=552666 /ORGANISM="Partenskyella glossopodia, Strain RCC365" /LENGTH=76 /DNA_ID=CAMNT_0043073173 /DNA_START=675 /DNA_END=905 /DNA_ORIENTATION=-